MWVSRLGTAAVSGKMGDSDGARVRGWGLVVQHGIELGKEPLNRAEAVLD